LAKVTFEFDNDETSRNEINMVINRQKVLWALDKVVSLRNNIFNAKLYNDAMVSTKNGRILTDEDYAQAHKEGKSIEDTVDYVSRDFIEEALSAIIDGVIDFIDF
jgi:hypothetical protein